MQIALSHLGYQIDIDGQIGSETQKIIQSYASEYNSEPTVDGVLNRMRELNGQNSTEITNLDEIRAIETAVAAKLADPEAAKFQNLISVPTRSKDFPVVCGQVNGKNLYNAYVGYQWFGGSLISLPNKTVFVPLDLIDTDPVIYDNYCTLGHQ